jgi:hypothetical protein
MMLNSKGKIRRFIDLGRLTKGRRNWRPIDLGLPWWVFHRAALLAIASAIALSAGVRPLLAQAAPQLPSAGRATNLFLAAELAPETSRRPDAAILRTRPVWVVGDVLTQPEGLLGGVLIVELFGGETVSLRIERLNRRSPDAYTMTGIVIGAEPGFFTLVVERDVVVANISVSGQGHYQLRYVGRGIHEIREIDVNAEEPCSVAEEADLPPSPYAPPLLAPLQSLVDDGSELDVLVVYTPAALAAAGGLAAIRAIFELGASETNFALENSGVPIRVRIVQDEEIAYQESGSTCTDKSRLRDGTNGLGLAHTSRNAFCADIVTLVVDNVDPDTGGCASLLTAARLPPFDFAPYAFHVAEYDSFGSAAFAHELGHTLGAHHDRENACSSGTCTNLCCAGDATKEQELGSYPYSYGHRVPDQWRTTMATSSGCVNCPRMPFYSNPTRTFGGLPTGVAGGHPSGADNALTFELNKQIAANWRTSCTDPPDLGLPLPAQPGDLLLANSATGELLRVDASGDRGVLSSDALGSGPSLGRLRGVAVESSGQVLVNDRRKRALLRVDPQTGDRTVFSGCVNLDCSNVEGLGLVWVDPFFFAMERSGDAVVTDSDARAVFRVARDSGDRTVLSGCSDAPCSSVAGGGPEFVVPFGVAIDSDGTILVAARVLQALVRIDPNNGNRTVISGCFHELCSATIGTGLPFDAPRHLAIEANGSIVLAEGAGFTRLIRVDPSDGDRTLLSGCEDFECTSVAGAGPLFSQTNGVAVDETGEILVSDASMGALFRVDPVSGDRTVFSGCVDASCSSILGDGPPLALPVGIAVVPEPGSTTVIAVALAVLAASRIRRSQSGTRHRREN